MIPSPLSSEQVRKIQMEALNQRFAADLLSNPKDLPLLLKIMADLIKMHTEFSDKVLQFEALINSKIGPEGPRGVPGRNPMTVSETEPINPQKGDLWYQP